MYEVFFFLVKTDVWSLECQELMGVDFDMEIYEGGKKKIEHN